MRTYMLDKLVNKKVEVMYFEGGRKEFLTGEFTGNDYDVIGILEEGDREKLIFKRNIVSIVLDKSINYGENKSDFFDSITWQKRQPMLNYI